MSDTTNYSFKLDHSISPTIKLGFYFSCLLDIRLMPTASRKLMRRPLLTPAGTLTARLNYDQSIRPTLLLHVGAGYIQQYQPNDYSAFDQTTLGLHGYFVTNRFPGIGGAFRGGSLGDNTTGGWLANGGGVGPAFISFLWEQKPTFNTSLTWVKGNHPFKYGADLTVDGYPERSSGQGHQAFLSRLVGASLIRLVQSHRPRHGRGIPRPSFL